MSINIFRSSYPAHRYAGAGSNTGGVGIAHSYPLKFLLYMFQTVCRTEEMGEHK